MKGRNKNITRTMQFLHSLDSQNKINTLRADADYKISSLRDAVYASEDEDAMSWEEFFKIFTQRSLNALHASK